MFLKTIKQAARASGIRPEDLVEFFAAGSERKYQPNEWLFQESTPRQWAGIVLDGDVELVRGLHGSSRHIATMVQGALISEGVLLDDEAHATGAFTRNGATVWQISRESVVAYRQKNPEVFYRLVAQTALPLDHSNVRGPHYYH